MRVLEPCRSQPQRRGATFLCGIACLFVYACTDGKGSPIIAVDSGTGDALGGSIAGRSGRIDAAIIDDDDDVKVTQTSECKSVENMWSSMSMLAYDENKLFERLNQLRANPSRLCPQPPFQPLPPLEWDPALQCSARLRIRNEGGPRGPSNGPSFYSTWDTAGPRASDQAALHDRERLANAKVDAEIIFSNVNKVDAVLDVLENDPDAAGSFCLIGVSPIFPAVGIARYGNVWVLDFGSAASGTPRSPSTTMGNSGSGNSGTGGR